MEFGDSGEIVRPLSHLGDFLNTATFSEFQRDKPSLSVFKELPDSSESELSFLLDGWPCESEHFTPGVDRRNHLKQQLIPVYLAFQVLIYKGNFNQ